MLYVYSYRQPKASYPIAKVFSSLLLVCGLGLLSLVVLPLANFQVNYLLTGSSLLNPVGKSSTVLGLGTGISKDYSNVQNWFVGADSHPKGLQLSPVVSFNLSIPKLSIKNANVVVDAVDLKKSLIGWATSVSPGSSGSVFVFGHSALPAFYSPTSYHTIFTHLYDLDYGDKIVLESDGVSYVYEVESKRIVKPDDLSVLEQRYDASRLVMITCLPAGTYINRGVVTARLVGT